jgi:hypothetical protein
VRAGVLICVVATVLPGCSGGGSGPEEPDTASRPSAADPYQEFAAIERIFLELDTLYRPDPRFERLTRGKRALCVLYWADSEILNGGLSQFSAGAVKFLGTGWPASGCSTGSRSCHRPAEGG